MFRLKIQDFLNTFTCEDVMRAVNPLHETKPLQQTAQIAKTDAGVGRSSQNGVQCLVATSHSVNCTPPRSSWYGSHRAEYLPLENPALS